MSLEITAMVSAEKEVVPFDKPVITTGAVEDWLNQVESAMKETLSDKLYQCLKAFTEMEREDWLFAFPAQCTIAVEQIVWTHNISAALEAIEVILWVLPDESRM